MDYKLFIMVKPNHFLVMSWSLVIPKLWLIMVDPIALQLFFVAKGLPAPVPTIQKTSHMKTRIDDGNVGRVPGRFKYRT